MPRTTFMMIGVVLGFAGTYPVAGSPPSHYTVPDRSGYWVRPVSDAAVACEGGSVAWGRNYRQGETIHLIDRDGRSTRTWNLPLPIKEIWPTPDCLSAWILSLDRRQIFLIDSRRVDQLLGLSLATSQLPEIRTVIPSADGRRAWLWFQEAPSFRRAEIGVNGIEIQEVPGLPPTFEARAVERALAGDKVWVVSRNGKELYLLGSDGFRRYMILGNHEWLGPGVSNGGTVAWLVPFNEKGLWLVDASGGTGNGGQLVLPDEQVVRLQTQHDHPFVWAITRSNKLFLLRADVRPRAPLQVQVLNGGRPILDESGSPLLSERLFSVGDGSQAWILPLRRFSVGSFWDHLWHLNFGEAGRLQVARMNVELFDHNLIRDVFSDPSRPNRAWVQTHDLSIYEIENGKGKQYTSKRIFDSSRGSLYIGGLDAADIPGRLWVDALPKALLVGPATDLTEGSISFDRKTLGLNSAPKSIAVDPWKAAVRVKLGWPLLAEAIAPQVRVAFYDPENPSSFPISEGHAELTHGEARIHLTELTEKHGATTLDVELTYQDDARSSMQVRWHRIRFMPPWYVRLTTEPRFQSAMLLTLPTLLLLLGLRHSSFRSWVPVLVPGVEMLAAKALPDLIKAGMLDLAMMSVLLFLITLGLGVIAPQLFRQLAPLQPFRALVPVALRFSSIKRRVYREYLVGLRGVLLQRRQDARNEQYVGLPLRVTDGNPPNVIDGNLQKDAADLVDMLTNGDTDQRAHVLIAAPGGRGKSALLHELVERCISAFERDPRCPLPVLGGLDFTDLEELTKKGLGSYAFSEQVVETQMKSGDLVLFLDGLSESKLEPTQLENFLWGPNKSMRLCFGTRPSLEHRKAFQRADRWIMLEPERLSDQTIAEFVASYAKADANREKKDSAIHLATVMGRLPDLQKVCRASDNTYLPILVRLWMIADPARQIQSVLDLYRDSIDSLLAKKPPSDSSEEFKTAMEELAFETYWTGRLRVFNSDRTTESGTQTVEDLLKVGILIGVDEGPIRRSNAAPRRVRFFHDSVQSYLTAKALHRRNELPREFQTAAGDPDFYGSAADRLGGGSELFSMCLEVFEPSSTARDFINGELCFWADRFRSALSLEDVESGLTPEEESIVKERASADMGPGEFLKEAVKTAYEHDQSEGGVLHLGRLYSHLAPKLWPKLISSSPTLVRVG